MIWQDYSTFTQDLLIFCCIFLPVIFISLYINRGFKTFNIIRTMLRKYLRINILIVIILALTLSIAVSLTSSERAFKIAMAKASQKFDLVVSAPGSKIDMMLATVYLQAIDAPLLEGDILDELNKDDKVEFAVPIAYGDSFKNHAIVGSTNKFVKHLSDDKITGSYFLNHEEAIVGIGVDLEIGDTFSPVHGHSQNEEHDEEHKSAAEEEHHENEENEEHEDHKEHEHIEEGHEHQTKIKVVGKMSLTNSPWDKAIIIPIESIWEIHGLGTGHNPNSSHILGSPFDPNYFPGTPAILVKAKRLGYNYSLVSKYSRDNSMAFFPGTVLSKLHALLSDIRSIVSTISSLSISLVILSVISTLALLSKLFSKKFAILRAIGAPKRFVFSLMYLYTTFLIFVSSSLGLIFGYFLTSLISKILSKELSIVLEANISWQEIHLLAAFFALSTILGLLPAYLSYKQDILKSLQNS